MKIISWNIRGLGSRKKRKVVKDFLYHENPDIILLQETKRKSCDYRQCVEGKKQRVGSSSC